MATVETVKVADKNEQGFIVINKDDLAKDQKVFEPKKTERKKPTVKNEE